MTWPEAVHDIAIWFTVGGTVAACVWAFFWGISR